MSRRWAARLLFVLAAAYLAADAPVRGQAGGAKDTVTYFDRKDNKVVTTDTEVKKESAAGIEILVGKDVKAIAAPDVVRVDYGGLPGVTKTDVGAARQLEDTGDWGKAQAKYAALLKSAGANPKAKRYLTYREAVAGAKVADAKASEDEFKAEAPRAAKALADFAQQNDKSWECWPAARTAARLQAELGDYAAAATTLNRLAKNADLPPDLRFEARLAEAAALLRSGSAVAATAPLDELDRDPQFPRTGPLRQRLDVLRVAVKFPPKTADGAKPTDAAAQMEKLFAAATDPTARAVGYNCVGDLYRAHGFPRDAMWAYLWVDTVYSQDRDERVYAVRRLVGVFDAQANADQAAQFRDKLPTVR